MPIPVYSDSSVAEAFANADFGVKRSRWVEMRYQYVRDLVERGIIRVIWVESDQMEADIATKFQDKMALERCVKALPVG